MRWLDLYIDQLHRSSSEWTAPMRRLEDFGPFGRVGSVANALLCAGLGVVFVVMGFSGQPFGAAPVILPIALEVVFVRICIRAFRGDFDLVPDDEAGSDQ